MSGIAVRFLSGKYQGGEFPLPPNGEIIIGRDVDADMCLMEDMVSRHHAKIITTSDESFIEDLGSTNGTFVNGERVKKSPIKDGDRLLVGTSILRVVGQKQDAKPAEENYDLEEFNSMLQEVSKQQDVEDVHKEAEGQLEEIPVADLLQMFGSKRHNGTLTMQNGDSDSGRIFLREGQIYFAMLNDDDELDPNKALFRMLGWESGEFKMRPPSDEEFIFEIDEPTESLVSKLLKERDAYRKLSEKLPELESMLQIPKPLQPPLPDLNEKELEIFQMVMNVGFFQSVLDQSPYSDLQTTVVLTALLEKGYVSQ